MTPADLAFYSVALMLIPAALGSLAVIISILAELLTRLSLVSEGTSAAATLHKFSSNIFYITFISVFLMNVTAIGLMLSAIWWLIDSLLNLF